MMTNSPEGAYSFRNILDKGDTQHQEYVLSEARYRGLMDFLCRQVKEDKRHVALDVGSGGGVISRGLADQFDAVIGADIEKDNIELATSLTREAGIGNVEFKHALATELPIEDDSVDLVVINGVLEWVGVNSEGENPRARQIRVLREIQRVLRPGGVLYLAIENRWHPGTLKTDPHSLLPWVNALPRGAANRVSMKKKGRPYQTWIYGWRSMARMLALAELHPRDLYVAFPGYQYPFAYIRTRSRGAALADIDSINAADMAATLNAVGRSMDVDKAIAHARLEARMGLLALLAHDHAFICEK
jgi:ubiquinone/menaquinone biosynthesis C-methylase UbiE